MCFKSLTTAAACTRLLVDIDLQALAHAADRRDHAELQDRISLINANLVYLALGRQKLALNDQDLIYSIGLTDYFNDKFVIKLLNWIHGRLRLGGRVILCNFHPNNYCKRGDGLRSGVEADPQIQRRHGSTVYASRFLAVRARESNLKAKE